MKTNTLFGTALAASLLAFGAAAHAQNYNPAGDIDRDGIQNRHDAANATELA